MNCHKPLAALDHAQQRAPLSVCLLAMFCSTPAAHPLVLKPNAAVLCSPPQHDEDDGDLAHRLTQIYDRMAEINAASAESRASKILHGLGFTEIMQVGKRRVEEGCCLA